MLNEELREFRATHPVRSLTSLGHHWSYISSGRGEDVLLLLEGGGAVAEVEFQRILAFEKSRRVISVTYPATAVNMQHLVAGIAAIAEAEGVHKMAVHGHSLGGALAQCFAIDYPNMVSHLILANIAVASARRARMARILGRLLPVFSGSMLGSMTKSALRRNIAGMAEPEREFYGRYFNEIVGLYLTKEFMINQFRCMLDFMDHYQQQPQGSGAWRGRVLIVEAEDDRGWDSSERAALRGLYPDAEVHTFRHGGHLVGMTQRAEYDAVLSEFLGKPAAQSMSEEV